LRRTPLAVLFALALTALIVQIPAAGADQTFKVIVHPDVEGGQIPRDVLSSIFLRDALRWGNGNPVQPVDQSMRAPVRAAFTEQVLSRPFHSMGLVWAQKIKKGITPPPVKSTDADVIAYVASTKGAIGYVSVGAEVPATVKTLVVID